MAGILYILAEWRPLKAIRMDTPSLVDLSGIRTRLGKSHLSGLGNQFLLELRYPLDYVEKLVRLC